MGDDYSMLGLIAHMWKIKITLINYLSMMQHLYLMDLTVRENAMLTFTSYTMAGAITWVQVQIDMHTHSY